MTPLDESKDRLEPATKAKYAAGGFALGLLVKKIIRFFFLSDRTNEDRPPIIVREGSISIEQAPRKGSAKKPSWVEDAGNDAWQPDHPQGMPISAFLVAVNDPVNGDCENLRGEKVRIFHDGSGPHLTLKVINGEPKIGPRGQLKMKNPKKMRHIEASGTATEIRVDAKSCPVSPQAVVWIWPVQ